MHASLRLNTRSKVTKKGYPIILQLFYTQEKRPKKTICHSLPEFWNEMTCEVLNAHPDYFTIIPIIKDINAKIAKVNYGKYTFVEAQNILFGDMLAKRPVSQELIKFIDVLVEERKTKSMASKNFIDLKATLIKHANKQMLINDVTYEWLNVYSLQMLSGNCGRAGLNTYLRTLRTVYKEAQRRETLNIKKDNPFIGLIKTSAPKPKEALYYKKDYLIKLLQFQPVKFTTNNAATNMYRNIDLFFLQFYLGGIDFLFIALMEWNHIVDNRLVFNRNKTRNKTDFYVMVNNTIPAQAMEIIYNHGNKNTKRIFSHIPHPYTEEKKYSSYRNNVNRSLRKICQELKIPIITTKSPRYIFRTFAGNKLIHDLLVMKLQGHKPTGVTYVYQGTISKDLQDENHLKVIDLS